MDFFTRHGGPESPPIAADMCLACGGLWLDGGEVALAYPALAVLGERRADVMAVGDASTSIGACPRCAMPSLEVPFFDVSLDVCTTCFGVWIDGDELEALSRTMDRGDGLPVPDEIVGGYRTAAVGVMTKQLAKCALCDKQVPLRSTRSTPRGAVCEACAKVMEDDFASRPPVADDEEEDYVVPGTKGFWGFLCDVGDAVATAINAVPRCTSCGCRSTSHCHH